MKWNFFDYAYAKWRKFVQGGGTHKPYDHADPKPKDTPPPKPTDDVKIGPS